MWEETKITGSECRESFIESLFVNKANKRALGIIGVLLIIEFITFKMLYPFANFMPDSYSYIEAALNNYPIHMWPIGYSKFLRIFNTFVQSDTALVFVQFVFLQGSILTFIYTFFYFIQPGNTVKYILLAFFLLNPAFPAISNYISSDSIFTGISMLWIVQLIWLLQRPKPYMIWLLATMLLIAFSVRYNALYYPIISVGILLVSKLSIPVKLSGLCLSILFIGLFIWHSGNIYKEVTGKRQFSAFGGWQLASNALFAYSHVPPDNTPPPAEFKALHVLVLRHLDSLKTLNHRPDSTIGTYYLWDGPLAEYQESVFKTDTTSPFFKRWASLAPLYGAYGQYLIKKYPGAFARYFLLPNAIRYYMPPAEFLNVYNMKKDTVAQLAENWFGYKNEKVKGFKKELTIFDLFQKFSGVINTCFFIVFIGFLMFYPSGNNYKALRQLTYLSVVLWLANGLFSLLTSPIVLRYQIFSISVSFTITVLLANYLVRLGRNIFFSDSKIS